MLSSSNVDFLVGKIIGDVEKVFLNFAGQVKEDTVFLGSGAVQGLNLIDDELHKDYDVTKFMWVHNEWQAM